VTIEIFTPVRITVIPDGPFTLPSGSDQTRSSRRDDGALDFSGLCSSTYSWLPYFSDCSQVEKSTITQRSPDSSSDERLQVEKKKISFSVESIMGIKWRIFARRPLKLMKWVILLL